jgi:hypothetical protein
MAEDKGPDAFAKSMFIFTMIGIGLYCGAVLLYVL